MAYENGWSHETLKAALENGTVDIWDYLDYDRGMADLWAEYGKDNINALVHGYSWTSGAMGIYRTKDVMRHAVAVEEAVSQEWDGDYMEGASNLGEAASNILECAFNLLGGALLQIMRNNDPEGFDYTPYVYLQGTDEGGYVRREDSAPTAPFRNVRKEFRNLPAFEEGSEEGDQLAYVIEDAEGLFWVVWHDQQEALVDFLEEQC